MTGSCRSYRVSALAIGIILLLGFVGAGIAAAENSAGSEHGLDLDGDGTQDSPYQISNVTELQIISEAPDAHYIVTDDIDANATVTWNDGAGFVPIGSHNSDTGFTGSLDGNGHTISGLTIDRADENKVGLFATVSAGSVSELELTDTDITGGNYVGGVAGSIDNAEVTATSVTGDIEGETKVGGVGGYNDGLVSESFTTGTIQGVENVGGVAGYHDGNIERTFVAGEIRGENQIGGIAGATEGVGTDITESYALASVEGVDTVGGLVGANDFASPIQDSYVAGQVKGEEETGGIAGSVQQEADIEGVYWDSAAVAQDDWYGTGGVVDGPESAVDPLETDEMQTRDAFESMPELEEAFIAHTDRYPTLDTIDTERQFIQQPLEENNLISIDVQPDKNQTVGQELTGSPQATVTNVVSGNVIPRENIPVAVSAVDDVGDVSKEETFKTDEHGVAKVDNFKMKESGDYRLRFTIEEGPDTTAETNPFTVTEQQDQNDTDQDTTDDDSKDDSEPDSDTDDDSDGLSMPWGVLTALVAIFTVSAALKKR